MKAKKKPEAIDAASLGVDLTPSIVVEEVKLHRLRVQLVRDGGVS